MNPQDPIQIGQSTGFVPIDPVASDWIAGQETGILELSRLPSSDWRVYLSAGKWQKLMGISYNGDNGFETDACVSFSGIDSVEAFMNWSIKNNAYSPEAISWLTSQGYFDASGMINLSPRFTAKMSGTTTNGNNLPAVAASLRHDGCIPNQLWDMPAAQIEAGIPDAWTIYYSEIPQNLIALGQEFSSRFEVQYEWISYPGAELNGSQLIPKLQVAPLQIATAVCAPWNTSEVIQGCGSGNQHATLLDNVETNGDFDIRDHYEPFDKILASDYVITYSQRIVCVEKAPVSSPAPFKHTFTMALQTGESNSEIVFLQNALKQDGEFPLTVASTGYYGSITQASVLAFQRKYQVDTPEVLSQLNGSVVGAKTNLQLNKLFS